jgi:HEAT repeat protein
MRNDAARERRRARRLRPGTAVVLLTALACLTAIIFRTPIRSRYWAWRIAHGTSTPERAMYLTLLCNAGGGGRWGTAVLLEHEDAEIRQFGVVVLHQLDTDWARQRLLRLLEDPDETVRELAALGLAIHADESVIPELKRMYSSSDETVASSACVALGRIATPTAVAALTELAVWPAEASRRADLVDALAAVATPACVAPLLELLEDHRTCDVPPRVSRLALEALRGLQSEAPRAWPSWLPAPQSDDAASLPIAASGPSLEIEPGTVAERAAAALTRITGLSPPFSSGLPAEQRNQAKQQWAAWHAGVTNTP